jgi:hypothetical protein
VISGDIIRSARPVAARVEQSRIVAAESAVLPPVQLGLKGFSKVPRAGGAVALYDVAGNPCGLFVNEGLADACISSLTR